MFKNICPKETLAFGIASDEPIIYDATITFFSKK